MTPQEIEALRNKFFQECTRKKKDEYWNEITLHPDMMWEWILSNCIEKEYNIRASLQYALVIKQNIIDFPNLYPIRTDEDIINEVIEVKNQLTWKNK